MELFTTRALLKAMLALSAGGPIAGRASAQVYPNRPLRLVVPWKYGFKGVKAITKIRLVEKQPVNSWQRTAPNEYGFYANVNPNVDHPRWSQAKERRLPSLFQNHKTEMFNGYGEQVASLYAGMDLRKYF